jgi:hypothetical protein
MAHPSGAEEKTQGPHSTPSRVRSKFAQGRLSTSLGMTMRRWLALPSFARLGRWGHLPLRESWRSSEAWALPFPPFHKVRERMGHPAFIAGAESFRQILRLPSPSTFTVAYKQQQVPPLHRSSSQIIFTDHGVRDDLFRSG